MIYIQCVRLVIIIINYSIGTQLHISYTYWFNVSICNMSIVRIDNFEIHITVPVRISRTSTYQDISTYLTYLYIFNVPQRISQHIFTHFE